MRLAEDPERLQALYDEQVKCHGDGKGGFNPLEYDTLQTPLLSAFIKEVLRLHLPLHSLMRKVVASHTVPTSLASPSAEPDASAWFKRSNEGRSYTIPEGNFVLAAPGFTQVDKRIWGQQAEEFDTEKWLKAGNVVGSAPGEEDMGEEDYGFGKISKGGKSACELLCQRALAATNRADLVWVDRRPTFRSRSSSLQYVAHFFYPPPPHRFLSSSSARLRRPSLTLVTPATLSQPLLLFTLSRRTVRQLPNWHHHG